MLDLDQRQACDGIEVLDPGDPQHTAGDQRRGEVPEGGGEDPGRIGQVRGGGEAFGRQAGIPAACGVLARSRS